MTSEFEKNKTKQKQNKNKTKKNKKKIYIYIDIKSLDKALHSYKEKGIHWNLNLTKCTWILKYLLYLMTFILELVHLSHRLY